MKLRKSTFRYIENEIYDHHDTKKALEELTEDIILSTPPHKEIRSTDVSDPTFMTASMLATNKIRTRMIDTVYSIDIALINLDPEVRDVLEDKYWTRTYMTWQQIADDHHVVIRTLNRWRTCFVEDVAKRMGIY